MLPGPVTYLTSGKVQDVRTDRWTLLDGLVDVYERILQKLAAQGAKWVQIDEPVLALDLTSEQRTAFNVAWSRLAKAAPELKIIVASYFGALRENLPLFFSLPPHAFHLDLVRAPEELDQVLGSIPQEAVIPRCQLWINPDCGLKTRGWAEVKEALVRMVATARKLRTVIPTP